MIQSSNRFLVFQLETEMYAVPLHKVREVIAPTEVTKVPHTPSHFKGVMNLRGQVISVIDLRLKFKMKVAAEAHAEMAIIILDFGSLSLGIIVDTVSAVLGLKEDQISPSPDIETSISKDFITGIARVENKLIVILDIEKSLNIAELMMMRAPQTTAKAS
ncbi:MAG: purine-binding chemotaxis protein CheW [Proteobacteria bacterium]|nr:MAG: purine-binding chemotaxis protein CheW [Pseudomonadota bacterium]